MDGYLVDTNILSYLFSENHRFHDPVKRGFEALPAEAPIFVAAIVLGEIEFGHRCVSGEDTDIQHRFNRFVTESFPHVMDVRRSTRKAYGMLRANLFDRFAPRNRKSKTKRPEELVDPTTAKQLGVQENDIWITALALEHNLTLVTHDMKMRRLWEAAGDELRVVDWASPGFRWPEEKPV